jgi:ribosomal protein L22
MKKIIEKEAVRRKAPATFRVTDPAVEKFLKEAENKSEAINEALRLYGGQAIENVIVEQITVMRERLARVREARARGRITPHIN